MSDFILGPQVPVGTNYFDTTQIAKAKQHGAACPVDPPTEDNALNAFILLHYYDLPMALRIAYERTKDQVFLDYFRKAADAWWKHPTWIKQGTERPWPDSAAPPPRHAGIGGLILRALDGRPEMWDWIVGYTQAHLDIWCKSRINNDQLWYGPREVAFSLQYAAWVAKELPDSFPNAAQIRTQLIADLENLVVNYTGRLQYPDGSWRDSSEWVDADGGTMISSMQPFIVGLLICALIDVHQVISGTAKENCKNQILKACRHLYSDGPYAKDLIDQRSGRRVRGFHYFFHGGTTVNPTKYAQGDLKDPWTDKEGWWLSSARQAISTILPGFAYSFKLTGDQYFKDAYAEMYDSAYSGTDGARAFLDDTAKNYNQHARRVPASLAWIGGSPMPPTTPPPAPTPTPPAPTPIPSPTPGTPSPDGFKGTTVVDAQGAKWTIGANQATLRDGVHVGGGQGSIYKYLASVVYTLGTDKNWYKWAGAWSSVGAQEPGGTSPTPQPPAPTPTPTPAPAPAPTLEFKVEPFNGTEAGRTAAYQRMWLLGYGAWSETDAEAKGNKIKFRKFP